jgi:glutaminase
MRTCGHYHGPGEFACRVGLPGKSGVGNSHLGKIALEILAKRVRWSIFGE